MRGRFHVIVLDEADEATERAQVQLLSRLDSAATLRPAFGGGFSQGTPPPIMRVFTANGSGRDHTDPSYKFERRFLSRCVVVPFPRPSDEELADYLAAVHQAEGRNSLSEEDFLRIASVSDGLEHFHKECSLQSPNACGRVGVCEPYLFPFAGAFSNFMSVGRAHGRSRSFPVSAWRRCAACASSFGGAARWSPGRIGVGARRCSPKSGNNYCANS